MSDSTIVTQLYDNYAQAAAAVKDLEISGVASSEISLVANQNDQDMTGAGTGATVGALAGGGAGLLAGLGILAIPGVGPVVAAGWLAATALGAAAGATAGGVVGALVDSGVNTDDAEFYAEGVRRGGTLVTVRCLGSEEDKVSAILHARNPVDPDVRKRLYRDEDWTGFDDSAQPYRPLDRNHPQA